MKVHQARNRQLFVGGFIRHPCRPIPPGVDLVPASDGPEIAKRLRRRSYCGGLGFLVVLHTES